MLWTAPNLVAAHKAIQMQFGEGTAGSLEVVQERHLMPFDVDSLGVELADLDWLTMGERYAAAQTTNADSDEPSPEDVLHALASLSQDSLAGLSESEMEGVREHVGNLYTEASRKQQHAESMKGMGEL